MRIKCSKENLTHAVQTVQKAVSTKNTLPVLSGIYLSAKDNQLTLQATDYEIGISCTVDAEVEESGTIVVSGRYLQELARRLPGEVIEISTSSEERTVQISTAHAQYNLLSMSAEEFPVLKPLHNEKYFVVKDNILREMIRRTTFACATDEARPIFTGALLEATGVDIRMIATNTHRLSFKKDILENMLKDDLKIIIPSKILNELARLLNSDIPLDVKISWHRNQVSFEFDKVLIISRIIEGQFPDYRRVIPESFETKIRLSTDAFSSAVERVSLLARDGEYNVIKFMCKNNGIKITSNNPDVGKAEENIEASMEGNDIEISFNAKYVTDILKNISSEELIFSLNTPLSPASIKNVNDESFIYIITPVRTV